MSLKEKKYFPVEISGHLFASMFLKNNEADFIVLEVSSFQLEEIKSFKPIISIMLNITADHLDRYESMDDYIEAKKQNFYESVTK